MDRTNLYGLLLVIIFSLGFVLALASPAVGYLLILIGLMILVNILNGPEKEVKSPTTHKM